MSPLTSTAARRWTNPFFVTFTNRMFSSLNKWFFVRSERYSLTFCAVSESIFWAPFLKTEHLNMCESIIWLIFGNFKFKVLFTRHLNSSMTSLFFVCLYSLSTLYFSLCSRMQLTEPYDSHPWYYGPEVASGGASRVCTKMGKRFCNEKDLEILFLQNRTVCTPKWLYNSYVESIFAHFVSSAKRTCLEDGFAGVFPSQSALDVTTTRFWCVSKYEDYFQDFECSGNGQDYVGSVSVTETGEVCQNWYTNFPNKVPDSLRSSGLLYSNACRNPNKSNRPWCFLAEKSGWGYCNVSCSVYGTFEPCKLTLYKKEDFEGDTCVIEITEIAQRKIIDLNNKDYCKGFNNKVRSFKMTGRFCHVYAYNKIFDKNRERHFLFGAHSDSEQKNVEDGNKVGSLYFFDMSADVVLAGEWRSTVYEVANDDYAKETSDIHECTMDEVMLSKVIAYRYPDVKTGLVVINGKQYPFYFPVSVGAERTNFLQTWCCLNEHPARSPPLLLKSEAAKYCSSLTRKDSSTYRNKEHTRTRQLRMCSNLDMAHHFSNYNLDYEAGWVQYADGVKGSNGETSGSARLKAWCCDEDCLEMLYPCSKHSQCCSSLCLNHRCIEPSLILEKNMTGKGEKRKLKYGLLWLIVALYLIGWCLRCLFPKIPSRRPVQK